VDVFIISHSKPQFPTKQHANRSKNSYLLCHSLLIFLPSAQRCLSRGESSLSNLFVVFFKTYNILLSPTTSTWPSLPQKSIPTSRVHRCRRGRSGCSRIIQFGVNLRPFCPLCPFPEIYIRKNQTPHPEDVPPLTLRPKHSAAAPGRALRGEDAPYHRATHLIQTLHQQLA